MEKINANPKVNDDWMVYLMVVRSEEAERLLTRFDIAVVVLLLGIKIQKGGLFNKTVGECHFIDLFRGTDLI